MMNDEENIQKTTQKKVHIILKNNYHYNGTIQEETTDTITLLDVKKHNVQINKDSISIIEELQ